jgi:hypothetical protein
MSKMGRPRQDIMPSQLDYLEAFCCRQVIRIQEHFHTRFGFDYVHPNMDERGRFRTQNRKGVMPQNDAMTGRMRRRDCTIERRG